MSTFVRESYREMVNRLKHHSPDLVDRQMFDCLKSLGPDQYETLMNRGGALAAAIQHSQQNGSRQEFIEVVGSDCEQFLLQSALMANGVKEVDLFQRVTFRLPTGMTTTR